LSPPSKITTKNVVGEPVHRTKAQSGHWLGCGKSNQEKSNPKPRPNRFPANRFSTLACFQASIGESRRDNALNPIMGQAILPVFYLN
jgi:hypothetical protein